MQMLLDDLKIKLSLVIFGREMMIKLVNGIPDKLVEMDEQVTFVEQMNQDTIVVYLCDEFMTAK
jgi:hypothetical protein